MSENTENLTMDTEKQVIEEDVSAAELINRLTSRVECLDIITNILNYFFAENQKREDLGKATEAEISAIQSAVNAECEKTEALQKQLEEIFGNLPEDVVTAAE